MYPEFFHIGPFPVRAYGVMLAAAFFLGILYLRYLAKRDNRSFEELLSISYVTIFGGVIGARLAYVLFHLDDFSGRWTDTFNPFASGQFGIAGMNLYGGVLLAMIGIAAYARLKKLRILDIFDIIAPTLALGIALGRIGCLLNGCCFGTPCDLPWGISYDPGSIPYSVYGDAHLHPAQIYSALYGFGLFGLTHVLIKKRKFFGQVVSIMLMVEAVFRVAIEHVRYYEAEMFFEIAGLEITYNYAIGILLFSTGLIIYITQKNKPQGPS
ncbi:MAG: prolipoprotein diacylglyceryl transferase [bacterium]|nr:prolipoprotein diacylglyceryl transferase [bacterium]